jgi:RimJ/RimL family protein N-acetyltransferase
MTDLIELDTERLRLRQWREEDREPFATLNADLRVMEFFPAPLDRVTSDGMLDRCKSLISERGWGLWAVELKATREFIGYVGLHVPVPELPCSPCVEIGWRLAAPYWGYGYATEAAVAALEVGFDRLHLSEIVSFTTLSNTRSRRVMERLGMQFTGELFEHPALPINHPLRLHCLYRLSFQNWKNRYK